MRRRMTAIREALRRRHRDESGKVKFLTIVVLAALVGGGYWGWVWVPLALDNMDVRHRCQESLNSTWRRNSPQHTKDDFLRRVQGIRSIEVEIGGDLKTVPAIDPDPHEDLDVRLDQSVRPPVLSIDVYYEREVPLPFLDRTHIFHFTAYCERETR